MSGEPDGDSSLIDLVADRFERAWLAGEAPRIEQYLDGAAGTRRARLFEELFHIEKELRARDGSLPDVDEYRRRFPDLLEIIDRTGARSDEPARDGTLRGGRSGHARRCLGAP